jgi:hypothetical protein
MTPRRIPQEELLFINPMYITAYIAVVHIGVVFTGEPTIVEATIVVWPLAWR